MARKTVDLDYVRGLANALLLNSSDNMEGERKGIAFMLESILMESGKYNGFRYLSPVDMEKTSNVDATSFGQIMIQDSEGIMRVELRDQTRRHYY